MLPAVINRALLTAFVKQEHQKMLGGSLPVHDGRKTLFVARALPLAGDEGSAEVAIDGRKFVLRLKLVGSLNLREVFNLQEVSLSLSLSVSLSLSLSLSAALSGPRAEPPPPRRSWRWMWSSGSAPLTTMWRMAVLSSPLLTNPRLEAAMRSGTATTSH